VCGEPTLAFARLVGARHLVAFHHDPGRDDASLEAAVDAAVADVSPDFPVTAAAEGHTFDLGRATAEVTPRV